MGLDLRDGQVVEYDPGTTPLQVPGGETLSPTRQFGIVVVDKGVYQLGARFSAANLDEVDDVIRLRDPAPVRHRRQGPGSRPER